MRRATFPPHPGAPAIAGGGSTPPRAGLKPRRTTRRPQRGALRSVLATLAVIAFAVVALSQLTGAPGRILAACLGWTAFAGALELLSIAGFVLIFRLVFGGGMSWRQTLRAGLRGLAASVVLPAGGLIGPAAGARSSGPPDAPSPGAARSAVTFLLITSAPGVVVLAALGLLLWEGGAAGPRRAVLTVLPAALALAAVLATWLMRERSASQPGTPAATAAARRGLRRLRRARHLSGPPDDRSGSLVRRSVQPVRAGAADACRLLASMNWQLTGALAYYAFDNAVLWATFRAYGAAPPVSVIVMGYLVGSLTGALPLPAGVGIAEGGMIGALVLYGAPAAPSIGAVLLYRAVSLSLPVLLGAAAWRGGRSGTRRRPARLAGT
jgi:uncharacterized membrane protein YbhN (UPF0104 family)